VCGGEWHAQNVTRILTGRATPLPELAVLHRCSLRGCLRPPARHGGRTEPTRDISRVYKLLTGAGVSQHRIGRLTGQSQSEVSEILHGRRVMGYGVLVRIADGLGVSRGEMGLAYDEDLQPSDPEDVDEDVKRRRFLAAGSLATVGHVVLGDPLELPAPTTLLLPARLGVADVSDVQHAIAALRARGR